MQKILKFISLIFFLFTNSGYSQYDNKWLIGYNSVGGAPDGNMDMDFSNNQLDSIYFRYRNMNFEFANASICDSGGNLLFYTNGIYIANALDDTMLNGNGLNPSVYTTTWYNYGLRIQQADIIIPKPGSDSLYYLFHETINSWNIFRPQFLYQSIINMNGDSGKGEVILKNHVIIADTLVSGSITLCRHANGRDWWLLAPSWGTNVVFNAFLITPDTIELLLSQTFPVSGLEGGQACFSPDGSKYVINNCYGIAFFDFDRCTGSLILQDNIDYFQDSLCWIGTSISPNSRYCYLSHGLDLYQYDLNATSIVSSQTTVASWDSTYDPSPPFATLFVLHQLAPDGKIYISHGNSTFSLHVIDQPDSGGVGCDVLQHAVALPRFNVTIPNFPNYYLGRLQGSPCDTLQWAGIAEHVHDLKFKVYPNPVSVTSGLHIGYLLPQNKSGTFSIYDVTGKVVFKYNLPQWSNTQHFKLPGLSDGVYSCVITSDGYRVSKKMVVMKAP